jgi:putative membrane protein
MKRTWIVWIALTAAVAVGCNRSDRTGATDNAGAVGTSGEAGSKVSGKDRDFVHDVAVANMAEVELGRLATERAADPAVKKFGQMMIDDHTKAASSL